MNVVRAARRLGQQSSKIDIIHDSCRLSLVGKQGSERPALLDRVPFVVGDDVDDS